MSKKQLSWREEKWPNRPTIWYGFSDGMGGAPEYEITEAAQKTKEGETQYAVFLQ